ncbi:MAG TPA: class I SAM-dependent methyltransferase [Solirubrobacterales bacterium]|nr:class I SAM-dependent methyltransferase [Solirubrobacterales bacterium]
MSESMAEATYDRIGIGYRDIRGPDPRIAARLEAALGDARTVLNVGAGTGSYEPVGRQVTAVEPSEVMIAQRPPGAAPVVRGRAEELPFEDDSFDAAMAIITVHHWDDPGAGIAEMARVARRRVVVLTFDPPPLREHWLVRDYVPGLYDAHVEMVGSIEAVTEALPGARVEPVPMPRLCEDAFWCALWDRPELHLDPGVRRASSGWHRIEAEEAERGLAALRADLESGAWDERYGYLRTTPELDIGLRLVVGHVSGG